MSKNLIPYTDRAAAMQTAATRKLVKDACKHFTEGEGFIQESGDLLLAGIQKYWLAGREFTLARGGTQMTFDEHFDDWFERIEQFLTGGVDKGKLRSAVLVFRKLPQMPTDLKSAAPAVQMSFETAGLLPPSVRELPQAAHEHNLFTAALTQANTTISILTKLEREQPFDRWAVDDLSDFVRNWSPVARKVEDAETILRQKTEAVKV